MRRKHSVSFKSKIAIDAPKVKESQTELPADMK